ncbi:thiosulfate dehydrogenase [quinone] large subunit [Streptomyces sp. 3213]|uniref:DoxX family membrane protein n=1 Tax=Streptomyces sp. 3213.3 TaxID=1855348 RepID=UPI00089BC151|nr:DoxX family membrane protein [Streptomyces sp. 3213.3]SEC76095.1 thiosulfate dehydrogenase [quinone] large subunit [Streptomyces sp. 3213] [Streptomyces sp. 3213.3]
MAVQNHPQHHPRFRLPSLHRTGTAQAATDTTAATTAARAYAFASLRLVTGFVFLWAFLDKTFGFGYATPSGKGWIDGGSPTKGFLSSVAAGPMESTFHDWAGAGWANWLFMLGLLGVGIALVSGVALRLAAVAGTAMMALMWIAEWPPAKHLSDGTVSMSSNPFVDYHLIYAVVLIALAAAGAGVTWGLGKLWATLPIVRDHTWLR